MLALMQDAVLHIQCSVPPERLDTFMVNGILIAAVQAQQHQLIMQQCLDLLEERGLAWNSTTWRQVLRLQVTALQHECTASDAQWQQLFFKESVCQCTASLKCIDCRSLHMSVA